MLSDSCPMPQVIWSLIQLCILCSTLSHFCFLGSAPQLSGPCSKLHVIWSLLQVGVFEGAENRELQRRVESVEQGADNMLSGSWFLPYAPSYLVPAPAL